VEHTGDVVHIRRSPYFQVCGDRLVFAYNTDAPETRPLWVGSAAVNLSAWQDHYTLTEGLEPKLQVVAKNLYYEYFARDGFGVWQIGSATSRPDFSEFKPVQRTFRDVKSKDPAARSNYGVEQEGNIQVVGDRIFYAFPQKDDDDRWQMWTASSNRDGSKFVTQQRTVEGGWIPDLQVAGDSVYYIYGQHEYQRDDEPIPLYIAKSDLDGGHWRVIAQFNDNQQAGGVMMVDANRLFFGYVRLMPDKTNHIVTGSMDLDGGSIVTTLRPESARKEFLQGLQVVGSTVHYAFIEEDDMHGTLQHTTAWFASAGTDGGHWEARKVLDYPPTSTWGYQPFVVVGGKTYYSALREYSEHDFRPFLGTSGSNIVSKGDAFGLGLSEGSRVTAFINAGEDYLYRGEAPVDPGGVLAESDLEDDGTHQVAGVYDGQVLKLYVDGELKSTTKCTRAAAQNDFPVLLGDGFVGLLKDVRIFNKSLQDRDVDRLFREGRRKFAERP
jgi:hypothetical protein